MSRSPRSASPARAESGGVLRLVRRAACVLTIAWCMILEAAAGGPAVHACAGDCDGDRAVTVAEVLRGVDIAVGTQPLVVCPRADGDSDGVVSVADLVSAVHRALVGCADLVLSLSSARRAGALHPALLGHYDLSGALFGYETVPGLREAMAAVGFAEWRIGLGRWEAGTLLLPTLTDGTQCPRWPTAQAYAPAGSSDLDLLRQRDWFVDTGAPVTAADTEDDARYALAYVRSAIDTARAFDAAPFVSIDLMPRALAANRAPRRQECDFSFTNRISNVAPADPAVFAAAASGMVRRVLEGSHGEPGRWVSHWEVWNEPELHFFWDPAFDSGLQRYLEMAVLTLTRLDAYRRSSDHPQAPQLRFGLGSFARAESAVAVIRGLDANPLPGSGPVALDFLSFHSYDDDPAAIIADIRLVSEALADTRHYQDVEIALAEWGPSLAHVGDAAYGASIEPALVVATAIAGGNALGLDRAHQALFWDYYKFLAFGLLDHAVTPRPLYRAYELLHALIGTGATRLVVEVRPHEDSGGEPMATLAAEDAAGRVRVLLVNRSARARTVEIEWNGAPRRAERLLVFDDPTRGITARTPPLVVTVPARSLVLAELGTSEDE